MKKYISIALCIAFLINSIIRCDDRPDNGDKSVQAKAMPASSFEALKSYPEGLISLYSDPFWTSFTVASLAAAAYTKNISTTPGKVAAVVAGLCTLPLFGYAVATVWHSGKLALYYLQQAISKSSISRRRN